MAVSDKQFELLQEEVKRLRQRMEHLLSRAGGRIEGNVTFTGDLKAERSSTQYTGYLFVPLGTVATSTQWDGDAKTTADNGIIDLSAEFGLPPGIRAVVVNLAASDETVGVQFSLLRTPSSTASVWQRTQIASQLIANAGVVPCDDNGDIAFNCSDELDAVYIRISGYFI